jgi:hypothetical protein
MSVPGGELRIERDGDNVALVRMTGDGEVRSELILSPVEVYELATIWPEIVRRVPAALPLSMVQ